MGKCDYHWDKSKPTSDNKEYKLKFFQVKNKCQTKYKNEETD